MESTSWYKSITKKKKKYLLIIIKKEETTSLSLMNRFNFLVDVQHFGAQNSIKKKKVLKKSTSKIYFDVNAFPGIKHVHSSVSHLLKT